MSIIAWIILGLIAGYIGSKIVDREGKGLRLNMALGIIGAIVGEILALSPRRFKSEVQQCKHRRHGGVSGGGKGRGQGL